MLVVATGVELELTVLLAMSAIYLPVQLLQIFFFLSHVLWLIDGRLLGNQGHFIELRFTYHISSH